MSKNPTEQQATPTSEDSLDNKLGRIVSAAICDELDTGRWFINTRSLDDYEKWTKEDFHGLDWKTNMSTAGSLAIGIVARIKKDVAELIQREVDKAKLEARIDEHTMVRDEWSSPGISYLKTKWSINRLKELSKLQEEQK